MKYGFVKVASASPASSVADSNANAQRIIEQVTEATSNEVELILFPELCLTSRSCGDLFTQPHFIQSCNNAITRIARETASSNAIIVFGAPVEHRNALYNCAVVMHKGEIIGIVPKRYLNTQTGESRWFASADSLPSDSHATINGNKAPFIKKGIFSTGTYSFGIEIGTESATPLSPGAELATAGAQIILNPTAEPAVAGEHKSIQHRIAGQSERYRSGYVYC